MGFPQFVADMCYHRDWSMHHVHVGDRVTSFIIDAHSRETGQEYRIYVDVDTNTETVSVSLTIYENVSEWQALLTPIYKFFKDNPETSYHIGSGHFNIIPITNPQKNERDLAICLDKLISMADLFHAMVFEINQLIVNFWQTHAVDA